MRGKLITAILLILVLIGFTLIYTQNFAKEVLTKSEALVGNQSLDQEVLSEKKVSIKTPTQNKVLENKQISQTFNNCGPATLTMILNYYGVVASQQELGLKLRPYQNPQGDNDDKTVTFPELAREAEARGFYTIHRPNGDISLLKKLIANDIPIMTRTWLKSNEDIGHYRIVTGFDESSKQMIQDDSYQGPNLRFGYQEFLDLWQPFNYEYLIVVPQSKKDVVLEILQEDADEKVAWTNALERAIDESQNTTNPYPVFNQSVANFYLGNYSESIIAFEKVADRLPKRMLWYQIEPISSYQKNGNIQKVFEMTAQILNNHNRAFSELYIIRGEIYLNQGKNDLAKTEFENAVLYNKNSKEAQQKLEQIL